MENGNKESMLAFQIETAGALACVEDICKVPGVDIAFVGPADLATDMGLLTKHGPKAWASEEYINAEKRVMAACAANNVVGGYWLLGDLKSKSDLGSRKAGRTACQCIRSRSFENSKICYSIPR